jgi:hypothetical protein
VKQIIGYDPGKKGGDYSVKVKAHKTRKGVIVIDSIRRRKVR